VKIIAALTLAVLSCFPLLAQGSISGSTTIQIDPSTNIVTAACETILNGEADTGYYAARVTCVVVDSSGNTLPSGAYSDDGDVNGYADVILTFTGVPGATYTATGGHTAGLTVPFDAPIGQPQGLNFDPLNFYNYVESPTQTFQDGYDWLGPGPEVTTRLKTLHIGNTIASATASACPTSVTLNSLTPISITTDSNLRTGYGAMASMLANPTTIDWSSAVITETITPSSNSCPNPGSLQPAFQTVTLANSSTFPVGQGALTFDYPQSQASFPAIPGAFYDEHSLFKNFQALGTGTCSASAIQTYVCGGKTLGTFAITKTFTAGTANGGPATIVTVNKQ